MISKPRSCSKRMIAALCPSLFPERVPSLAKQVFALALVIGFATWSRPDHLAAATLTPQDQLLRISQTHLSFNVQDPLEKSDDYPWYSSESNGWDESAAEAIIKRQDQAEQSDLRSSEWIKPPKKPKNRRVPNGTNNPGSGTWGAVLQTLLTVMFWLLVALLFAGVIGFLLWALLRDDQSRAKDDLEDWLDAEDDRSDEERIEALPFELKTTQTDLLALARQAQADGNPRQAMIYLYSHMLIRLDRAHLIRLAKGKTNRQYLMELGRTSPVCSFFERTMVSFESAFFGDHDLPPTAVEQTLAGLDDFHQQVENIGAPG